jgi:ribonuclease PH
MNFVVTSSGRFVEVQGTAEAEPFTIGQMDEMRTVALAGISQLLKIQQEVLAC